MAVAAPIDPKDFYIHHRKNETVVRMPGEVHGLDLMIEDLDDCTVYILDHSAQITIDYCNRCRFVIGPVDGPLFIRNCVGCTVTVACRQLRTRECVDSDFFLYCATKSPIIESSHTLRFHPYNVSYPLLREHFKSAKLDPAVNHNDLIYDFTAADASLPTPHWTFDKTVPAMILLKLFDASGAEIGGDATTPLADVYPSITEERVDKAAAAAPAPAAATPAAAEPAPVAAVVPVLESFGSNSVPKFSAPAPAAAAAPASSADAAASSAAPFEAGVAPSIPSSASVASPASSESVASAVVAELVDSAVASAASEEAAASSAGSSDQASSAPSASSSDTVIIKEASFSILTSAEEASKALFELAGVAYVPPSAAAPAAPAAAASSDVSSAPAPTPSPPVDEEARLAAWFTSAPGMIAAAPAGAPLTADEQEQAALEARVAEAERKRLEALEQRRQAAAAAAASSKAAATASMDQFYQQREAEQVERRKATSSSTQTNQTTTRDHALRPNHSSNNDEAALLAIINSSVNAAPSAAASSSSAAASSSSSSAASASASSFSSASALDSGWATVLSMLPAGSLSKHSASDLQRMKLLYLQLKAAKSKSDAAAAEEARRARRDEKRRRKKEKKKKKRAKRREKKRAAEAARIAAIVAAGGTPPEPKAADHDGSSSDSSSSSSSDDSDDERS